MQLKRTPASYLLEIDLGRGVLETEPTNPISAIRQRGKPNLHSLVRALHEAADDKHAAGLIVTLGATVQGIAVPILQELRDAIVAFANSGKLTVAHAETFGEESNASASYFLATGCREIWLQPSGSLNLLGISSETTFLRGALDKLGVEPQVGQRYEYKNAADRITQTKFTDAHREAYSALTGSIWDSLVAGIAQARGLTDSEVRAAADRAPLPAMTAQQARLVDRLGYRDEVYADTLRRLPEGTKPRFVDQWEPKLPIATRAVKATRSVTTQRKKPVVALVDVHGMIAVGRSRRSPLNGPQAGSHTVCAALRAARDDERVEAVVIRVDSPGGSAVASDTMWREVVAVREAGKPVVVSMGSLAASGGYYIACPADVIVAQPTTITGSIGVLGGKPVINGMLDKVGLSSGIIGHGAHASIYSPRQRFNDDEWQLMNQQLDAIYADFTEKVADGRHMTQEQVHEVARGRVWSGADALERGLVDALGGLRDATRIAREKADLAEDAPLRPAVKPSPLDLLSTPKSSDDPRAAMRISGLSLDLPAQLSGHLLLMPDIKLR